MAAVAGHEAGDAKDHLQHAMALMQDGRIEPAIGHLERAAILLLGAAEFDPKLAAGVADRLERAGAWRYAWPLWARTGLRAKQRSPASHLPEWDGSSLAGRSIVVEKRMRQIGAELRLARLLARVSEEAGTCIAYADPRLVALFRRSFPKVETRPAQPPWDELAGIDVAASYETLGSIYLPDAGAIAASFTPLQADLIRSGRLRATYGGDSSGLLGISWFSTNRKKDIPDLGDWRTLFSGLPARYVSLQYDPQPDDLHRLRSASPGFVHDPAIDPLLDLDGHAAQVAALDAVITISNTTAHMAGALGAPCVVLLDDKDHLSWPAAGDRSPWYPSVTLLRKAGRPWSEVMQEAAAITRKLLAAGGR